MAHLGAWFVSLLLVLQAAATTTATVWPRQYSDTTPSAVECIEKSLSNPNWYIVSPMLVTINGSTGGTIGDIQFFATNTATGTTAKCDKRDFDLDPRGPGALDVWHSCNVTDLGFQFNLTSFEMRLKGSWRCEEKSPFLFSGSGTWEEPLIQGCLDDEDGRRGDEILCIMGNSQVSVALTSPVTITPQLPLLPFTPSEPYHRCVDRSIDPEWVVEQFAYQHHFSQLDGVTKQYYDLNLNLTNMSNGEKVPCSITVDEQTSAAARGAAPWVKCAQPPKDASLIFETEVMLDPTYGVLGVRQAWNCTDGIYGIDLDKYTGTAYFSTALVCGNPVNIAVNDSKGTVIGSKSDYNCSLVPRAAGEPFRFSGYWPDAPTMPHTPYTRSCTIGSFVNTSSLTLRDYQIETTTTDNKTAVVGTFTLTNAGSGDTYRLSQIPISADGAWHQCVAGTQGLPWQLVGCQYLVDRKARQVGFKLQWYCDDRDPSHPILFDATAMRELPAEKCEKAAGTPSRESCVLPGDAPELKIPVSNLTWKASPGPMDRGPILPWI